MGMFRRCYVVVLLGVLVDVVNPGLPGIFSLQHGNLYVEGIPRAQSTAAEASRMRVTIRPRTFPDPVSAATLRYARASAANRRGTHDQPLRPRLARALSAEDSADPEEH
ncbi:MAG: hypothetical protein FJ027_08590 [Candidatus Rokubacteria bacterium]|nr:hypothetical protein [Candidatus Rokubacteria bacterium]